MAKRPLGFRLTRLWLVFSFLFSGATGVWAQLPEYSVTPSTCGKNDGSIVIIATFGGAPYTFYIDGDGPYVETTMPSHTFNNLVGGHLYNFSITDISGTTVFDSYFLSDLSPTFISIPTPASCLDNDGTATLTPIGGAAPYSFSVNGGSYIPVPLTSTGIQVTGLPSGVSTATIQDGNGCFQPLPVTVPLNNDLHIATGTVAAICEGTSIPLPAASTGTVFVWTPSAGLDNPNTLSPMASPSKTTLYTLTAQRGTSGVCPAQTADVLVTVNPAPVPDAGPDDETCSGRSIDLVGNGGGIGGTYKWTPATFLDDPSSQYPVMVQPTVTMTYNLQVTDALGCVSLKSDAVTITVTPPLKVFALRDTTVFAGQPVQLFATAPAVNGPVSYEWTPGTGLNNPLIQNPTATIAVPQVVSYVARITTTAGCTGTDTVTIKAFAVADILVPNGFTPNNDGHNDVLRPVTPGIKELKYFTVVNRYGQQVFTTNRLGLGWDGALNGRLVEAGTFVWMAEGVDVNGKVVQRHGTVVLIR